MQERQVTMEIPPTSPRPFSLWQLKSYRTGGLSFA